VRPLDDQQYPFPKLIQLLADMNYDGWVMLEDGKVPDEPVSGLAKQRMLFERMVADLTRSG
jgi:sugar phosphate isomerase/epimerase